MSRDQDSRSRFLVSASLRIPPRLKSDDRSETRSELRFIRAIRGSDSGASGAGIAGVAGVDNMLGPGKCIAPAASPAFSIADTPVHRAATPNKARSMFERRIVDVGC